MTKKDELMSNFAEYEQVVNSGFLNLNFPTAIPSTKEEFIFQLVRHNLDVNGLMKFKELFENHYDKNVLSR